MAKQAAQHVVMISNDESFMLRALALADKRKGFCSPNPSVGAVVVKEGRILSEGFHLKAGKPHAEVEALKGLSDSKGSMIYVTLEPCCHFGKTPPCTQLLIEKKIGRVVYGFCDPNPVVFGKGGRELRAAGIAVECLPLAKVSQFYESYAYWTRTQLPWVTMKLAISQDWKISGSGKKPVKLTGAEADRFTHELRRRSDAILTTASTVCFDDPKMTVRLDGEEWGKKIFILDRCLRTPSTAQVIKLAESVTFFHVQKGKEGKRLLENKIDYIEVPEIDGKLDLESILEEIGKKGVHDLLIEGGAVIWKELLEKKLVQRVLLYRSPVFIGDEGYAVDCDLLPASGLSKQQVLSCGVDKIEDWRKLSNQNSAS